LSRSRTVLVLAAAAACVAAIPTVLTQTGPAAGQPRRAESLLGTWDTGPIPAAKVRSALIRAGYTATAVARLFRIFQIRKAFEFEYVFYRKDGALFQVRREWEPPSNGRKPAGGERGPYRLLPGHRFVVSNIGPPTDGIQATFAYELSTNRLRLHFSGLVVPIREAQVLYERMMLTASASRPYKRIG
jgi:hypothetical protein